MFDLTAFAKFEISGPGALTALQRLAANQMNKPVGSVTYTPLLTPTGGMKCDLTITRLGEDRFMVITGGAFGLHDLAWIEGRLPDDGSVTLEKTCRPRTAASGFGVRAPATC